MPQMDREQQKILEKVQKLLRLSEKNRSEQEAAVALLKARELMAKYRLSLDDAKEHHSSEVCQLSSDIPATAQWEEWLFALVCKNYRCLGYYKDHVPVFLGLEEDAKIARTVYRYAHEFARKGAGRAYKRALAAEGSAKGVRASYLRGFVVGLKKQFEEAAKQQSAEMALIMVTPKEVLDYHENLSKDLENRHFRAEGELSVEAYRKGFRDGRQMPKARLALLKGKS